ncbi:NADAR family protein [Aureivirga marina]|uniref:NADAR family protein n=1 Tax=Aureivirga marina TaxID=1182451 RepID=UPI0018CB1BB4|nr:NADAR family protein [Aureivirga marina]
MKQKYDLNWLLEKEDSEENIKYLFFWGHSKKKNDTSVGKFCLSQWYQVEFTVENVTFNSTEHWMMAEKAKLFKDKENYQKIISCKSPAEAKKLGQKVRNFDEKLWKKHRYEIVKQGNYHKFSQHEDLKNYLLNTKNRVIVEASPVDRIWGIGLSVDSPIIAKPSNWRGLNLLGFALMEVREMLQ